MKYELTKEQNSKYRIKERFSRFFIEKKIETIKTKGYLWWKKEVRTKEWKEINHNLDVIDVSGGAPISFIYIEEAKEYLKKLNEEPKYYY